MLRRNLILVMRVKTKYLSLGHALTGDCSRHPEAVGRLSDIERSQIGQSWVGSRKEGFRG